MTVREVVCKSALTRTGIPGARYALNPYTGCTHACVYCYASFMTRFSGHTDRWGTWVDAKVNIADVLEKEIRRKSARRRKSEKLTQPSLAGLGESAKPASHESRRSPGLAESPEEPATPDSLDSAGRPTVLLSSVTDPYQPVEASLCLTRACLKALANAANPLAPEVSILTKSALVARDIPILRDLPGCEVGMTITALDDALARQIEPGASAPSTRLKALEQLASQSIKTWVFISPVLPHYGDSPAALAAVMKRAREAGVSRIGVDRLNLYPAAMAGLARISRPEAVQALRAYKSSPQEYLARLRSSVSEAAAAADMGIPVQVFF
ncbi:MAG TPA: radical SAM protein [Bacillota bacterium]|nr:radical SAM protein [Bacillota bacterium]HOI36222.1 radical SAM protein [Bacillota bacterium]